MRYYGRIGFAVSTETSPGVMENKMVYKPYYGDVLYSLGYWQNKEINDDIKMQNRISVICDDYIQDNLGYAKIIEFDNHFWKIQSFTLEYPRVIITIGGLYNENSE